MESIFASFPAGTLELRQGGRSLFGSFPYGRLATMSDRGRVRKEIFMPKAFSYVTDVDLTREINLLSGHDFNKPLASRSAGTLEIEDTAEAFSFEALLPAEGQRPSWMNDTVTGVAEGLIRGLSPGFRIPPAGVPLASTGVPQSTLDAVLDAAGISREPSRSPASAAGGIAAALAGVATVAVIKAVEQKREKANPSVEVRQINAAVLHEMSLVTRPNYEDTIIEIRQEDEELEPSPLRVDYQEMRRWL